MSKVTHIYRVDIGHGDSVEITDWVYARNAKQAKAYCREKYKDRRYDHYKMVMVGENSNYRLSGPSDLTEKEKTYIQNTPAKDGDKFAYHRN